MQNKGKVFIIGTAFALSSWSPLLLAQSAQITSPQSAQEVPGPIDGAPLTSAYVKTIGGMAYLWAWPLVNMQNRQKLFATVTEPGLLGGVLPVAPLNQLSMLSDYISPEQRFVTSPNQDVVYGAGFLKLDEDPVVIQVPDFGKRFWVYQIVDQRTDSFTRMGIQYNTKPGLYLLVGPNWKGKIPDGIDAVYHSPTNLGAVFPRIFMDDTNKDRKAIQPLIDKVMMYPLSEFTGKFKKMDWSELPDIENPNSDNESETQWVIPEEFFTTLSEAMKNVPPLPGEEAMYSWIRSVITASESNEDLQEVLIKTAKETEKNVLSDMFEYRNNGIDAGNGWRTQKNSARFGSGYFQRTATAKGNMFSNMPEETVYFGADFDSKNNRLNGENSYEVTFEKGELPPVNGFWSLTLYNKKHFFNKNDINRYSLGTKNKDLVFNDDGSLTIIVQQSAPKKEMKANWLPSPEKEFSLYIRAYWPKSKAYNGDWIPPKIQAK